MVTMPVSVIVSFAPLSGAFSRTSVVRQVPTLKSKSWLPSRTCAGAAAAGCANAAAGIVIAASAAAIATTRLPIPSLQVIVPTLIATADAGFKRQIVAAAMRGIGSRMSISVRSLPLNALRSFDAAARHLNFTAAAAELKVTPGAISAQIRRLEEWAGVPLFVRGHRSVALSEAGARLAPRLTSLFVDMERLLGEVADIDADALQVSTIQSFAAKWLAPRIGGFGERHPGLQIRVLGEDRQVDFDRDGVDVALRYGDGRNGELHAERIAPAVAVPVCSPALAALYPDPAAIPPELLIQDESSLIAPGLPTWEAWFAARGTARVTDRGPLFHNAHMAIAAALGGQGFALGLTPLIDRDVAEGRLVRPWEPALESPFGFWFVCRADRLDEPKIAAFRQWVFEQA